jgi:hypothetical protein
MRLRPAEQPRPDSPACPMVSAGSSGIVQSRPETLSDGTLLKNRLARGFGRTIRNVGKSANQLNIPTPRLYRWRSREAGGQTLCLGFSAPQTH